MNAQSQIFTAINVPTRFVDSGGRKLAYRMFGEGQPLLLCLRFRGVMDSWDPAFLDALARNFTVITFDYSGLGQSTGEPSYDRRRMARDAKDVVDALGLPMSSASFSDASNSSQ